MWSRVALLVPCMVGLIDFHVIVVVILIAIVVAFSLNTYIDMAFVRAAAIAKVVHLAIVMKVVMRMRSGTQIDRWWIRNLRGEERVRKQ